jgi:hypothetical protein
MQQHEKAVCELFGAKDLNYISKRALVLAIANLNAEYELLHVDLYAQNPEHPRFAKWSALDRARMQECVEARIPRDGYAAPVLAPEPEEGETISGPALVGTDSIVVDEVVVEENAA